MVVGHEWLARAAHELGKPGRGEVLVDWLSSQDVGVGGGEDLLEGVKLVVQLVQLGFQVRRWD